MKLGIIKSFKEIDWLIESYVNACESVGVDYVILDLLSDTWLEDIQQSHVDGILVREKANIDEYKQMYNERLWAINTYLHIPIYPSWHELFLYENKRLYAYFFKTHNISTPTTHIFYRKDDALHFLNNAKYPLVFKSNGGSAGHGVKIISSKLKAKCLINKIFGVFNPRLALGHIIWTKYKGLIWIPKIGMSQRHYVIIQEYIDIDTEWRIIKIGESYAGYQRPMENGHGSCEKMIYGFPPRELLKLIKDIAESENFDSLSLDVLVDKNGKYYVTEMQSLYGSINPIQCAVDGIAGRIIEKNGEFVFEQGDDFFIINSNVLRVKDFVKKLNLRHKEI